MGPLDERYKFESQAKFINSLHMQDNLGFRIKQDNLGFGIIANNH